MGIPDIIKLKNIKICVYLIENTIYIETLVTVENM